METPLKVHGKKIDLTAQECLKTKANQLLKLFFKKTWQLQAKSDKLGVELGHILFSAF